MANASNAASTERATTTRAGVMRSAGQRRAEETTMRIARKGTMMATRFAATVAAAVGLMLVLAGPTAATITVESFTTSTSSTQAGGHPNLTTSFSLAKPGMPEAAKNVVFEAPQGIFGNPNALTRCTAADFAQTKCPP